MVNVSINDVLKYIETAPRPELMKIRNLSTRLAYPKYGKLKDLGEPVDLTIVSSDEFMGEPYRLAKLLWFAVKDNYSFAKQPDLRKWIDPIEKLHRVDGFDYKVIQAVIVWSTNDDFWKQQVRSGDALRRHFEKLLVKIKSDKRLRGPVEI